MRGSVGSANSAVSRNAIDLVDSRGCITVARTSRTVYRCSRSGRSIVRSSGSGGGASLRLGRSGRRGRSGSRVTRVGAVRAYSSQPQSVSLSTLSSS